MVSASIGASRVALVRQEPEYRDDLVASSVSRALAILGVSWSELIRPGDHVVIKPNLIREGHAQRDSEWEQIITHGTVIATVARQVAASLKGSGSIQIADAPQSDSDFNMIASRTGLATLIADLRREWPTLSVDVRDLRREVWVTNRGVVVERRISPDVSQGYTLVDLGDLSAFGDKDATYYGADYDVRFTNEHHKPGKHEYLLARLALDADVFINLPKLKTHKKVGVTMSLKNLVGINGDKNYLPHFALGTPARGGDEFPNSSLASELQSRSIRVFKQTLSEMPWVSRHVGAHWKRLGESIFGKTENVIRSGNWYGNDTTWRMVLDLNRLLFHFNGDGRRRTHPLRYLSIIDGIIGGDGNGPMEADPVPSGVLIAGRNPVAVDYVGAKLMGFDWRKIPMIREAFADSELPLVQFSPDDIQLLPGLGRSLGFRPHFGWVGHIEVEDLCEAGV